MKEILYAVKFKGREIVETEYISDDTGVRRVNKYSEDEVDGFYSEKQPNYKWSFCEDLADANLWKTMAGAEKKIRHAVSTQKYYELESEIIQVEVETTRTILPSFISQGSIICSEPSSLKSEKEILPRSVTTPYQMCINNVALAIRASDPDRHPSKCAPDAFVCSSVLEMAFCKAKEEILEDILKVSISGDIDGR